MKKINAVILTLGLCVAFVPAMAQTVSPVDFMQMNPYQMKSNPATDLPYNTVLSLVIGNTNVDLHNTTLRYDNFFDFDAQGRPTTLNLRKLANSVKKTNFLGYDASLDFLTLYRRLNTGMLTINYSFKAQGDAKFNDGMFKLLGYGNGAFVGENNPAKIDMDINAQVYQELAVGYQWNVTENLSLGGRAKLLFGEANITTDAFNAKLYTDAESYALRLEENIAMRMAMPRAIYAQDGKLMTDGPFKLGELFRNPGFGIDFAAEYRFDDRFSAVAAVHDLGFIHWGLNNIKVKGEINDAGQYYDDGGFLFNGMDVDQLQRVISDDAYRELFLDSLQQYFQVDFSPLMKYTTMLNTNLLLRGNFDVDAHNRFSLQVQGRFLGSGFRPAATLAYSGSFFQMLDVCATYTVMPGSYDNIGLGLAGNFGPFHIYLTTNNIIGCFKPLNASGLNAQAGIVFNMWMPERKQ